MKIVKVLFDNQTQWKILIKQENIEPSIPCLSLNIDIHRLLSVEI